jgi:hypothetical protein
MVLAVPLRVSAYPTFTQVVIDAQMAGDDKALADIDGDGKLDIIVGGMAPGEPLTWYEWPAWTKHVIDRGHQEFTTETDVGDMDGDGDVDLVVSDGTVANNLRYYRNATREGKDPKIGANWQRVTIASTGGFNHDVRLGDWNGDGKLDVLAESGLYTQVNPTTFARTGDFALPHEGMCFGDVDNDGDSDVVAAGLGCWYENPGWVRHDGPRGNKVRVGDVNGDGRLDIVCNSGDGDGPLTWYSTADPRRGPWVQHTIQANVHGGHSLGLADFDLDGSLDVMSAEMSGEVCVFYNTGKGERFSKQLLSKIGSHNAVVGDVDGDGDVDIMGCNFTGNPPVVLWRNGLR